jgi:hypothetical protein
LAGFPLSFLVVISCYFSQVRVYIQDNSNDCFIITISYQYYLCQPHTLAIPRLIYSKHSTWWNRSIITSLPSLHHPRRQRLTKLGYSRLGKKSNKKYFQEVLRPVIPPLTPNPQVVFSYRRIQVCVAHVEHTTLQV